ncbi:MAG: hypothetical protein PHI01_05920, partial [Candidatus Izemoplasmatales bacterium]|nr:hypothetical protein [Candidatus Izemoplasmatales bacterium]
ATWQYNNEICSNLHSFYDVDLRRFTQKLFLSKIILEKKALSLYNMSMEENPSSSSSDKL